MRVGDDRVEDGEVCLVGDVEVLRQEEDLLPAVDEGVEGAGLHEDAFAVAAADDDDGETPAVRGPVDLEDPVEGVGLPRQERGHQTGRGGDVLGAAGLGQR